MQPSNPTVPKIVSGTAKVEQSLGTLAPMATTFSKQDNLGALTAQQLPKANGGYNSGTILDKLGSFVGAVSGQVGGMIAGAATGLFKTAIDAIEAPFKLGSYLATEGLLNMDVDSNSKQGDLLQKQVESLSASFRAGRITREQYKKGLMDTNSAFADLNKNVDNTLTALNQNAENTTTASVNVAEDVIGIVTAGVSEGITALTAAGAKDVLDGSVPSIINFFGKREVSETMFNAAGKVDTIVSKAIEGANKVSTFNGKFSSNTIAKITNDAIVSGAPQLTTKQIATNVAVNIVLKKPLIYQTNIDIATNIYKDMQKGDIGGAALSTVLTASMALSGGPIGWALENAGKGASWLRAASFSGGNVASLMKAENEANIKSGIAAHITDDIINTQAKTNISQQSFIDALSTKIGSGKASQMYNELVARAQSGDINSYKAVKVLEETNMKMAGGDSVKAASLIADHYNGLDGGKWLRSATPGQVIDDMVNWASARDAVVQDAIKNGMSHDEAKRIVVGRANQSDLGLISDIITSADQTMGNAMGIDGRVDYQLAENIINARLQLFHQAIDRYGRTAAWANSHTFVGQVETIIRNNIRTEDMVKEIKGIKSGSTMERGLSDTVKNKLSKQGYIAILPENTHTPYIQYGETTGGIKSAYAGKTGNEFNNEKLGLPVRDSEKVTTGARQSATLFEHAVTPIPVLSSVTGFMTRLGLSPEASNEAVQNYFQANFDDAVKKASANLSGDLKSMNGKDVLQRLYAHVRDTNATQRIHAPVTDLRQMTKNEVKVALGVGDAEAKAVMRSISSSMLSVPVAIRGIGDKVQDINMALNPIAAKFSRAQGATRFVWNPFFRWQQTYQTEGLAQLESGGKMVQLPFLNGVNRILFPTEMKANDATVQLLENRNIFGQGFSGVGSSGDIQGKIGTRIIKSEKVSLAGIVNMQAKKLGLAPEDFVDNNQSMVVDTLRMITTNNHTQGFLDSPLARTINTVFFPFRYNMKVANLMAGYMGKLSAPTQVAIIGGLMNGSDWLKSDQGIAWQQTHSEAIGLFNWLSPTYPLTYVMKLGQDITDPENATIGDLGQLGGLPFGMISQMLESAGVIDVSAPYINPKTGDVYPKYTPKTAMAGVNLAIQDFVGALFSYPGAIVGLPSKTSILKGAASGLVGGNDFEKIDQQSALSQDQLHRQQVIKAGAGQTATSPADLSNPTTPVQGQNDVTSAPQKEVTAAPRTKTSSTSAKRKKKSEYIPVPLK